jgi:DNA adenine methylase
MTKKTIKKNKIKPFLRWAGGKRWLTKNIVDYLPAEFNNYHEPFIGGGSIFLYLKSNDIIKHRSFISDYNNELVNTYNQIAQNPNELTLELLKYKNNKEEYYKIRSSKPTSNLKKASKFIYLNKTSFNGLYRVNKKGEYNVPYGNRNLKDFYTIENIKNVSKLLRDKVTISSNDFYDCLENINHGDFVFLDPPYTVAHENNGFVQYNQKIFMWEDQERLKSLLIEINRRGAYFLLTNAKHESIKELFSDVGNRIKVQRHSTIGGIGASREEINEYIFTNIY